MEARGCSDVRKGHKPSNAGRLEKLEKTRKRILPYSLQKDPTLPTPCSSPGKLTGPLDSRLQESTRVLLQATTFTAATGG